MNTHEARHISQPSCTKSLRSIRVHSVAMHYCACALSRSSQGMCHQMMTFRRGKPLPAAFSRAQKSFNSRLPGKSRLSRRVHVSSSSLLIKRRRRCVLLIISRMCACETTNLIDDASCESEVQFCDEQAERHKKTTERSSSGRTETAGACVLLPRFPFLTSVCVAYYFQWLRKVSSGCAPAAMRHYRRTLQSSIQSLISPQLPTLAYLPG